MFRVRIAPLPDGLHQETFRPSAEDLELDPETFSDVEVDVRLDVAEGRVLAAYTARATARLECDRTLEMFDQPLQADHAVVFTAGPVDEDDEDVAPLPADETDIDLTGPVRDTLLLAVPLRAVSPAAEAADLPDQFGGPADDEPADDRWAALQALKEGDDSDSSD